MEFRILGPLEVIDGGRSLPLGGARQRAMLALLLTRPNEVVSTDRLIDELWGAHPPKTALNTIQYYVSQLRKALGADRIVTRVPGYRIDVRPGELDLERFESLVQGSDAAALREGLALWRGRRLATSPLSHLHRQRPCASKSSEWPLSSDGCSSTSSMGVRPTWSVSSKRSSASTRCASVCAAS